MSRQKRSVAIGQSESDCFEKTANKRVKQAKSAFSEVKCT